MTKRLIGLFASVALMGSGVAFANDPAKKQDTQQTQNQGATGGSGSLGTSSGSQGSSTGSAGSQGGSGTVNSGQSGTQGSDIGSGRQVGQSGMDTQLSGNQLTGRVVKSDKKTVWIEHSGAIVPLKIDKNTQFADPSLKRAQDLKEGDEIRASFEVRKTDNVATSIEKSTNAGMGGSGTEMMSPDSSINQSPGTLPSNDGTGGSGSDLGSDVNSDASQNNTSGDF